MKAAIIIHCVPCVSGSISRVLFFMQGLPVSTTGFTVVVKFFRFMLKEKVKDLQLKTTTTLCSTIVLVTHMSAS